MAVTIKVLIVDDDPANVELLGEICMAAGYGVVKSNDGERALLLASSERPDLILLDIMMPRMDGYEVLAKLKTDLKLADTPVIIVSAADEGEGKLRGLASGAAEFVHKPFRTAELMQRMKNVLELVAAKRQLREAELELVALRATDPVTGVGNFQRLHAVLDYEYGRAARYGRPLACAIIADESVDGLLSQSGRELADRVLQSVSKVIRSEVREVDRIFRIDIAEFVLVLPETASPGARTAIERILLAIAAHEREASQPSRLFCGLASFPHPEFKRAEDLFRAVNVALDQARRPGATGPMVVEFQRFS